MSETSAPLPRGQSEFEHAGLTMAPCRLVKAPRVAEAHASMECKLSEVVRLKSHKGETLESYLVIGEVVAFHIDEAYIKNGRFDTAGAQPLARCGYQDYSVVEGLIALARPPGRAVGGWARLSAGPRSRASGGLTDDRDGPSLHAGRGISDKSLDEAERRVCDLSPAVVDGQRVPRLGISMISVTPGLCCWSLRMSSRSPRGPYGPSRRIGSAAVPIRVFRIDLRLVTTLRLAAAAWNSGLPEAGTANRS